MKAKILIVGGTGFIGQNLINKIKYNKYQVFSIARKKATKILKRKITFKIIDITKKKSFLKIKKFKFNYIINLGGNINHKNAKENFKAHFVGLKNLINELDLSNLNLFIQVGSSLEYGSARSPQSEKIKCDPKSSYGKSKLSASKYLGSKFRLRKKNFIILRPYQVYGPFQKFDRLIPQVIKSCIKNKKFDCTYGTQKRDFLYIDDMVDLILKILKTKKIKSGIYNLGFGKPIRVNYVINLIKQKIGKGIPNFGKIKMRKDEIKLLYPSINKIKINFKWQPKISFKKGIEKTIKFYRKNA